MRQMVLIVVAAGCGPPSFVDGSNLCTLRLTPSSDLAAEVRDASLDETICLTVGDHTGPLVIDQRMAIIGEEGAQMVGPGPLITIRADGVKITDLAFRNAEAETGAALLVEEAADVRIERCDFTNGVATGDGGALWLVRSSTFVRGTRFRANEAGGRGASIGGVDSDLELEDVDIANDSGPGASLDLEGGTLQLRDSFVNTANTDAVRLVDLDNAYLSHDHFVGSTGRGLVVSGGASIALDTVELRDNDSGGIHVQATEQVIVSETKLAENGGSGLVAVGVDELTVASSILTDNHADEGGGLHLTGGGDVVVDDTRFSLNTATGAGAAILARGVGRLALADVELLTNEAAPGVIAVAGGPATSERTRFELGAATAGGALHLTDAASWVSTSDEFLDNQADQGADVWCEGSSFTAVGSTFDDPDGTDGVDGTDCAISVE